MRKSLLVLFAGLFGVIGIAARAFEAHGLTAIAGISQPRIRDFSSGTEMVLLHALALLGLAALADTVPRISQWAGVLFIAGAVLFCTPLMIYGLIDSRAIVMLAPFGGIAMIAGWAVLAVGGGLGLLKKSKAQ
jgi:uncharacterized membrane protein YgdD (TMEM256/DUF423 family)